MRLPVSILTGFLGAGKTTVLAHALAHPAYAKTAVIVNEFGAVSIDHLIVANLAENIIELRDGCLCCTIRGDLALTLRDLHRKRYLGDIPAFERVLVETTGLANPVPILHTLVANQPLRGAFSIDAVITVVDAEHGLRTLAEHDTATAQVALADIVVLSKTDCVDSATRLAILDAIAALNPGAECIEAVHGEIDPSRLIGRQLFEAAARGENIDRWLDAAHDHAHHGEQYGAHVIRHQGDWSLAGTSVFLNRMVNEFGSRVLRIKGIAAFREKGGRPAILHAVQNKFYPVSWLEQWPDADDSGRLVIIGRELDVLRIDELFKSLCV